MLRPRLNAINLFSKYFKGKILDAGCGDGRNTAGFQNVVGIDTDERGLKFAKERGLKVIKMDLEKKLKFKDEEFDTIICSHVLEHVRSPFETIQELKRTLKKRWNDDNRTTEFRLHLLAGYGQSFPRRTECTFVLLQL